jgi:uncharacterized YccA/Bax inhibitor family protein
MNKKGWAVVIFLLLAALAGAFFGGFTLAVRNMHVEAIKAGHAKHVIVDELGHTTFQWLEKGDK